MRFNLFSLVVFFSFTVAALPQSALKFEALEFTSIKQVGRILIPDEQGSVTISNDYVSRCFKISYNKNILKGNERVLNSVVATFKFNSMCGACGTFGFKILMPSNAEALRKPPVGRLSIPCKADILMLHTGRFPTSPFPGLESYIAKASSQGFTVKFAGIYKGKNQDIPQIEGGHILAGTTEQTVTSVADTLNSQTSYAPVPRQFASLSPAEGNFKYQYSLLAKQFASATRKIRKNVKPKYLILLGDWTDIPFYFYGSTDLHEPYFPSDHIYAIDTSNPEDEHVGVAVSRVPYAPTKMGAKMDNFFSRASAKEEVGNPNLLTIIPDETVPGIEKIQSTEIMPFYGVTQCVPPKCFIAPTACVTALNVEGLKQSYSCNSAQFSQYLSSDHLVYNGHASPTTWNGPLLNQMVSDSYKKSIVGNPDAENKLGTSMTIARSIDFINPSYVAQLQGAFINMQSCDSLNAFGYDSNFPDQRPLAYSALDSGAVAIAGFSGVSFSTFLAGKPGESVRLGDQFFDWKNQELSPFSRLNHDQKLKIGLYGDPLLRVRLT